MGARTATLSPCPVQQFDFRKAFADHGGEEKGKENAADQHVVVVVFKHIKLLWGVDSRLVDVQTVRHNLHKKKLYLFDEETDIFSSLLVHVRKKII